MSGNVKSVYMSHLCKDARGMSADVLFSGTGQL